MSDARRTVEVIWRIESPRLIASLTRLVRDVGLAEELAQDAFVTALEQWPVTGVPDKPGAWLMVTARHRAIDLIRREQNRDAKYAVLATGLADERGGRPESSTSPSATTCCRWCSSPATRCSPRESRIALTLRLFGGLTTDEIARAYLVPSPTIGQRISRAKRTLAEAHVPFEVPQADEMPARVRLAVLEVVYVIFTEGYAATSGDDVGPSGPCRRGDAARPGARRPPAARAGGARAGRADGAAGVALRAPAATAPAAPGPGPPRWDRTLIEHGLGGAGPGDDAGQAARPVHRAGGDRGVPQPGADVRGHRLGGDRRPLRRARAADPVAGGRAQPRGRRAARGRAGGGAGGARRRSAHDPRLARYHLLGAVRGGRAGPARAAPTRPPTSSSAPRPWRRRSGSGTC